MALPILNIEKRRLEPDVKLGGKERWKTKRPGKPGAL
jgi:hypothetical protein